MKKANKKNGLNLGSLVLTLISSILVVFFLMPIVWSVFTSMQFEGKQMKSVLDWFSPPYTLDNYITVVTSSKVPRWLFNSAFVAISVTILGVLFTTMAGYAIAKIPFKSRKLVYFYLMLGMMVPGEATIVPLFITVNNMNLINTYSGLILPSLVGSMNLIIMVTFIRGIPDDLLEAAKIDGASFIRIFWTLIVPLCTNAISTISIFTFMGSWNNYIWPLLSAMSENMFTLPVGIPTFVSTYSVDYSKPLAATMVASIPAIIVYIMFEKRIVQGIALSGIKG